MIETELLRAELERLFELDELIDLSQNVLGFTPDSVGGTAAKASFAGALTEHCVEHDAIEALCDALLATRPETDERVAELRVRGLTSDEDLDAGGSVGPYVVERKIGEGRLGIVYLARRDEQSFRLKVLRREATRDERGLHRYLTLSRLVGRIEHPSLPQGLQAGEHAGHFYVAHRYVEGQPLSARIARSGPLHINEARPLVQTLLEALSALHQRRLAHGDLRLENVIVYHDDSGAQRLMLLDAGADRLRTRPRVSNGRKELFATPGSPKSVSPEQIQGLPADARSDVYSLGALLYEILTGKPPFPGNALDAAFGHLSRTPEPPSSLAPKGWIDGELDALVLRMLAKDAVARPSSAQDVLDELEALARREREGSKHITEDEIDQRTEALLANPRDTEAAVALEAAVEEGAEAARVADAFALAADSVDPSTKDADQAKKRLLFRAARLFEAGKDTLDKAESTYLSILELDASDEIAATALEEVRRRAGKFEELIETLLARTEQSESATERGRAMAEIGHIYAHELDDKEQALVAYTQALSEDPAQHHYAEQIEALAGNSQDKWGEVLSSVGEASQNEALGTEARNVLLNLMGKWYDHRAQRPDLALPCFQAVTASDPANDAALLGMAEIYRKAQQWPELGMVLTRRADAAKTPAKARDLLAEAADILEHQINDTGGARELYERVLSEDPAHPKASEALARIYERTQDYEGLVKILSRRAEAARGEDKLRVMCRAAEIVDDHLGDTDEAIRRYQAVLAVAPRNLDALRGLDRVFSKAGRYQDLLDNLMAQIDLAATPRQKITLWERIAGIHDEEFLDHPKAAAALEGILAIDPAHEPALVSLVRHYRALDRWEDVSGLYERHLKLVAEPERRIELALAWGRVLSEQIGSPERATKAYELALEIDPEHAGALESLARLRESSGDADAALEAILALAERASTPEARAEQHVRAAKLLEARGDRDGAIEQYKNALDANPQDKGASLALREAYTARGDINAALQLLDREIEVTEGDRAKARLAGEIAKLCHVRLEDDDRAQAAAKRALALDPTNLDALTVLGDIAFDNKRFLEASRHYEPLAERADTLEKQQAVRILVRFVDSLSQAGSTEKALAPMDTLLRLAPDDAAALERVAFVTFEHGAAKRAVDLYRDLLDRFGSQLSDKERALAKYRYGEALRRSGDNAAAIAPLEEAGELDPGLVGPLAALAEAHAALENWQDVVRAKTRHLDMAAGEERVQLLVQIGEIAAEKLGDRTQAAKNFVAAMDERPDDRRLLTKLMQLYSEEKDWNKLVEVVLRLAEFVDEKAQKVKYLHTAALVTARQVGDVERALDYYSQVLELDPSLEKALREATELERERGNYAEVERLLKKRLEVATAAEDQATMLEAFTELAELFEKQIGDVEKAIDAYEAAHTLDPEDRERGEKLAELYVANPERYLDKAVAAQLKVLRQNPFKPEPYKKLRRLYTESKQADASWCLCQAMTVLNLAEPDEERFYRRMRADTAAPAETALTDEDWLKLLHPEADPLLTSVFALIEPAVMSARSQSPQELGYDIAHQVDLASHYAMLSQNLHYAAGVLGMQVPITYENTNDPGGLSFLHAHDPSIVLGQIALSAELPAQAAAFIAARHLTYLRPGLYLRQLIGTGTGLKSWLFAAIKLTAPQFPIAADIEGPVNEALTALSASLQGESRDHLTRVVSRMLQSGAALDLRRWIQGVDLTVDRAGFVVCYDLATAAEVLRASEEGSSSVPNQERFKELVIYAASDEYLKLRHKLGITID